ncbi:putative O-succinylbenzoic acid--CoA ligase [Brevibacterium mcbrellneri ATCC 49030]|uniref:Putative O-succinylbenzoic acid--CoA ligase n=1 Tax=Brevibacterium mcbrellneri ATCC 49030 TaxID=585530 RepID=D4YM11_9MICO|nr:AMP-binding protein [Brevibacterium mcbrellneri]EFG47747.1 putative O-succinylbenzoic acid--CoA ligase [Brevibacterium mcbrellneri ATCC 49030]
MSSSDFSSVFNLFAGALDGTHTLVLPGGPITELTAVTDPATTPAATSGATCETALVVHTSGSTGAPKAVALSAAALTASARSTERFLHGPGQWLLALPHTHIAGAQVILRSLQAGTKPVVHTGAFSADSFAQAAQKLTGDLPLYVSLVPTQLVRILQSTRAIQAARRFATILLGGAAISPALLERAHDAGLNIVRTYGMSETGGGCVYDGVPFDAVTLKLDDQSRVMISGPVLANGYVRIEPCDPSGHEAGGSAGSGGGLTITPIDHPHGAVPPGAPSGFYGDTFLTSDLGSITDGVLSILGRADDVFISGGVNVSPLRVENVALRELEPLGVAEVVLTSLPDPEFGERAVLLIAGSSSVFAQLSHTQLSARVKSLLAGTGLGPAELPHRTWMVDQIPLKGIGKPDRRAARDLAQALATGRVD